MSEKQIGIELQFLTKEGDLKGVPYEYNTSLSVSLGERLLFTLKSTTTEVIVTQIKESPYCSFKRKHQTIKAFCLTEKHLKKLEKKTIESVLELIPEHDLNYYLHLI